MSALFLWYIRNVFALFSYVFMLTEFMDKTLIFSCTNPFNVLNLMIEQFTGF